MIVWIIVLSVVAAVLIAAFITMFFAQFLHLHGVPMGARFGRSLLSAALWPVVLIAMLIARRKA